MIQRLAQEDPEAEAARPLGCRQRDQLDKS